MTDHLLPLPPGFDPATQCVVATWTAGLDDQLRRFEAALDGLSVPALEWQPAEGMNAIGMLAAHVALTEVWWLRLAPTATGPDAHVDARFRAILGIGADDDGITDRGTAFPAALRGRTAADYVALLRTARRESHGVLRTWTDADLERTVTGRRGAVSRRWILYHALEHFAGHLGQVLLLRHQLRDAGLVGGS